MSDPAPSPSEAEGAVKMPPLAVEARILAGLREAVAFERGEMAAVTTHVLRPIAEDVPVAKQHAGNPRGAR